MATFRYQPITAFSLLLILLRSAAAVPFLLSFVLLAVFVTIAVPHRPLRVRLLARLSSVHSRAALRLLGISVAGSFRSRTRGRGQLIVSNHLSWVDILVLSALCPSLFITSIELRSTFFLGGLARLSGCLFVERRSAGRLRGEISVIARLLAGGTSIVLFPEGTTSNGDGVRPFKSALFAAAVRAGARVLPVRLRYTHINGSPVTPENRDHICYYGGVRFFAHLFRVLSLRSVAVNAAFLGALLPERGSTAKDLARKAHQVVSASYLRAGGD